MVNPAFAITSTVMLAIAPEVESTCVATDFLSDAAGKPFGFPAKRQTACRLPSFRYIKYTA